MNKRTATASPSRRRLVAAAAILTFCLRIASAAAQSSDPSGDPPFAGHALRIPREILRDRDPARSRASEQLLLGALGRSGPHSRRFWITLGVIGGLVTGAIVGSKVEGDCHCDDPGLKGGLIGATIGAVGGGVLVWRLSGP